MVLIGGRYVGRYTKRTSHHLAKAAGLTSQSLFNVPLIHALDANQRLEVKLASILGQAQRAALKKTITAATQFGFMFLVAYSANALAFWQGSKHIARAAESETPTVTAGSVYTVIFVLLDGTLSVPLNACEVTASSLICHQSSRTFPPDIRHRYSRGPGIGISRR